MIAAASYEPGATGVISFGGGLRLASRRGCAPLRLAEGHLAESMPWSGNSSARHSTIALPTAVPYCIWKRVDRGDERAAIQRRRCTPGAAGEGDEADVDVLRQLAQEELRRLLRRDEAVRLDVADAHAERDVDRQHDRGAAHGSVSRACGAPRRTASPRRREEQRRRHVAAPVLRAASRTTPRLL
jgi:hypothetical protein